MISRLKQLEHVEIIITHIDIFFKNFIYIISST